MSVFRSHEKKVPSNSDDKNKPTGQSSPVGLPVSQRRRVGLNADPTNATHRAALVKLGVSMTRYTLYYANWGDPAYQTAFAGAVSAAASASLELLVVCHLQGLAPQTRAWGIANLPAFFAARAAQFPGLRWQVLNEMDGDDGFNAGMFEASNGGVTQLQRGQWYGQLFGPVAVAVRAADATAKVIGGGIALAPTDFVTGMLATSSSSFDAIAVHAYANPGVGSTFASKARAVRAVTGSALWCTEFGSNIADQITQANEIQSCLDPNDRLYLFDRCYLYALDDGGAYSIMSPAGVLRAASNVVGMRTAV